VGVSFTQWFCYGILVVSFHFAGVCCIYGCEVRVRDDYFVVEGFEIAGYPFIVG